MDDFKAMLAGEIEKKKKLITSIAVKSSDQPSSKYFKRADLVKLQEEEYRIQQQQLEEKRQAKLKEMENEVCQASLK